jgi:hypothetical protein
LGNIKTRDLDIEWHSRHLGYGLKVATGDVDGDGVPEIVAGTVYPGTGPTFLYIFKESGSSYHLIVTISLGSNQDVNALAVGDVDGDRRAEIIVGGNSGIEIYKLSGRSYTRITALGAAQGRVSSLAAADFDRDGRDEVAAAFDGGTVVYVYKYDHQKLHPYGINLGSRVSNIASGDVDGDRRQEILATVSGLQGTEIYILDFSAQRFTTKARQLLSGSTGSLLVAGDVDGDGSDEILTDYSGRRVALWGYRHGRINGIWQSQGLIGQPKAATIADIDGDRHKEIVVSTLESTYVFSDQAGGFKLEWKQDLPNGIISMTSSDLDRNGHAEVIVGTSYGYVYVLEFKRTKLGGLWVGRVQTIARDKAIIPAGKPDATRVVDTKVRVSLVDTKVLKDKIIVEGEIQAQVLYVANLPSQPVHAFHTTFSFLSIINLYGARHGMEALASFRVEYVDADVVSPREIDITVIVQTTVSLAPKWW